MLDQAHALTNFNIGYSFPSIEYEDEDKTDAELGEQLKNLCYSRGKYCSIGLTDSSLA